MLATERNSLDVVTLLLDSGAKVNAAKTDGTTPLHRSTELGNVIMVQNLLRAGADINARNQEGMTPLMVAKENVEMVNILIHEHAALDVSNNGKCTALYLAAQRGYREVVNVRY